MHRAIIAVTEPSSFFFGGRERHVPVMPDNMSILKLVYSFHVVEVGDLVCLKHLSEQGVLGSALGRDRC